jgi:hypothetical protein
MTRDEIVELAKEAGFFVNDELTVTSPFIEDICISPLLKDFANLAIAKEREECAKLCDSTVEQTYISGYTGAVHSGRRECAEAIRARNID